MKALRFLYSEGLSDCCNSRMLLVRSREGGFVSRNCLRCGKPDYVGQHHLPDLDCDFCGTRLGVRRSNQTTSTFAGSVAADGNSQLSFRIGPSYSSTAAWPRISSTCLSRPSATSPSG